MKLRTVSATAPVDRCELVLVLAAEGAALADLPRLGKALAEAKALGDLKTRFRSQALWRPQGKGGPRRLGCIGLGKLAEVDADKLRRAAALAQAAAEEEGVRSFRLLVDQGAVNGLDAAVVGAAIAEGLVLGAYRYAPPKREVGKPRKGQDAEVAFAGKDMKAFADGLAAGGIAARAVVFARDLENQPSNICTPKALAQAARSLAGRLVKVKVLGRREMEKLKMGALLGVAQGSVKEPQFVVLEYAPKGHRDTVCVVGKGLTFDTGGISIKPAAKMDEMRYDMCGAGAVLGLFHALANGAEAPARTRIVGLIAAVENMPSGSAQNPGDVVRAMDGHTIEVLNTDAEGRLVLADAICYAKRFYEPKQLVDLATLTGAVVVALGHELAGILGNDQKLVDALVAAGKRADEPLWQLPLWDCHKEQMKSKFADLQNINGPQYGGGTIAGAAFLSYFVGDTPWAHLDIAGTAWEGLNKDYWRSGAKGTAVRTLLSWLQAR